MGDGLELLGAGRGWWGAGIVLGQACAVEARENDRAINKSAKNRQIP